MALFIAFFRGINVGGRNRLPMKRLTEIIEENGYICTGTYIQSGNIIFQSTLSNAKKFPEVISRAIKANCKFLPYVKVLNASELRRAIEANPFNEATKNPKSLHLYFLDEVPKNPNYDGLSKLKSIGEQFKLVDKIFYLLAPDGIGRSKLAANIEKHLGARATARNWNTVIKIFEMASAT